MTFALNFFREFHFSFNFQAVAALLLRSAGAVAVAPPVVRSAGAVSAPGGAGGTPKNKIVFCSNGRTLCSAELVEKKHPGFKSSAVIV